MVEASKSACILRHKKRYSTTKNWTFNYKTVPAPLNLKIRLQSVLTTASNNIKVYNAPGPVEDSDNPFISDDEDMKANKTVWDHCYVQYKTSGFVNISL